MAAIKIGDLNASLADVPIAPEINRQRRSTLQTRLAGATFTVISAILEEDGSVTLTVRADPA